MPQSISIADTVIAVGERVTVNLPLPDQSTYTPMTMPVHVVRGREPGPVLFVSAAIHGDEVIGVDIIRRLLLEPALKRLRGTVICVPIVNVFGFVTHSRSLPDRRDLNRSFPGSPHGSLAARIAYTFAEEIVKKSTHGIDLHSGSFHRTNHPHIRANLDDPETERLAKAFGTPVIINANLRDGSLRQFAADSGIPMLLYEAGEALRFDALARRAGVTGILNVMRALDMLPATKRSKKHAPVIEARSSTWVRAPQSGIFTHTIRTGTQVREGDVLGNVADPFGNNQHAVYAKTTGIIIGRSNLPVVNEGDALFHIARFTDVDTVSTAIETFHEAHIEGLGPGDYVDAPAEG